MKRIPMGGKIVFAQPLPESSRKALIYKGAGLAVLLLVAAGYAAVGLGVAVARGLRAWALVRHCE